MICEHLQNLSQISAWSKKKKKVNSIEKYHLQIDSSIQMLQTKSEGGSFSVLVYDTDSAPSWLVVM